MNSFHIYLEETGQKFERIALIFSSSHPYNFAYFRAGLFLFTRLLFAWFRFKASWIFQSDLLYMT